MYTRCVGWEAYPGIYTTLRRGLEASLRRTGTTLRRGLEASLGRRSSSLRRGLEASLGRGGSSLRRGLEASLGKEGNLCAEASSLLGRVGETSAQRPRGLPGREKEPLRRGLEASLGEKELLRKEASRPPCEKEGNLCAKRPPGNNTFLRGGPF